MSKEHDPDLWTGLQLCRQEGPSGRLRFWKDDIWKVLEEPFGATRALQIRKRLIEFDDFFIMQAKSHTKFGATVVQDAKPVLKAFRAQFPDAPKQIIESYRSDYMIANR